MKIPPLHDIDLARIAPMPIDEKRAALQDYKLGPFRGITYQPVRKSLSDLLNIGTDLFEDIKRVPLAKIEQIIATASNKESEKHANLKVARGLYHFVDEACIKGRPHLFRPMMIGNGESVSLWYSAVIFVDGKQIVPFIDPRSSRGLEREARRFAFSMMNEHIREAELVGEEVSLGIIRFESGTVETRGGRHRPARLYTDDQAGELFSYSELEAMISETYEVWRDIYLGRVAEERKKAANSGELI